MPKSKTPLHGEELWSELSSKTWESPSNLRETCEYIRENWYSEIALPDDSWKPF